MLKQLRDLSSLVRQRGIPIERMTWVEVRREKTSVAIEFSTEQDAATFGSTQLSDGSGTQKLEDADIISYSTELTYREHLFKFILFVPKSEQSTLVQQRTN